jgi:hypothetical protein
MKISTLLSSALFVLLLVDGNPLDDVTIMAGWQNSFKLIMKDGEIFKNTL